MLKKSVFLFLVCVCQLTYAQQYSRYQNYSYRHYDRYAYTTDSVFHTATKPYELNSLRKFCKTDSLYHIENDLKVWKIPVGDIVLNRSLIQFNDKKGFSFTADPLMNLELAQSRGRDSLSFINTRGFLIEGTIGDKFAFQTRFYENQAGFSDFRDGIVKHQKVIPGQGEPKKFKETGYDYASSQGYISYTPSTYFNFMLGHGKHHWGDGYRSLLLSDNSFNYPFFKIKAEAWRLKYDILYAQMMDLNTKVFLDENEKMNGKKWGVFHYLDFQATKWLSFGFFESVIWQNADSSGNRGFDVNYLNPVVFFRPVEFSVGSPDNVLMGVNAKIRPIRNITLYGQFLIDEFFLEYVKAGKGWWGNKFALQAGFKAFDIGIKNLDLQAEANLARPYTYAHRNDLQNYAHYNQPIAHPLGANFYEGIAIVKYRFKRLFLEAKTVCSIFGLDQDGINYGKNVYRSYYDQRPFDEGNKIAQGLRTILIDGQYTLSFLINPATNLNIAAGLWVNRYSNELENKQSNIIFFALRTSLENIYYDYYPSKVE